ncbi:MAG: hypothetical protein HY854_03975 [Burkholderiales bacterium]|nr:hypothetical protein [Burkholderiales bacterium]
MRHVRIALTAIVIGAPSGGSAQEWTYEAFHADGRPLATASFRLSEASPGKYVGRFTIPNADVCFRGDMAAAVSQEGDLQVVTLTPAMRGCAPLRLVLRADGSGGQRHDPQADGSWAWDGKERGLRRR